MVELLGSLTKKVRIECEESHRQYVAAMNGMAALAVIDNQVITHVLTKLLLQYEPFKIYN